VSIYLNALAEFEESYCCFSTTLVSEEDEVVYRNDEHYFVPITRGCFSGFSDTFQRSAVEARRRQAWSAMERNIKAVIGAQLGCWAFTGFTLQKFENGPLTVRAYRVIKNKAGELEVLHIAAYKTWKSGRLYLMFEKAKKKRCPSSIKTLHAPTHLTSFKDEVRNIKINKTGLEGLGSEFSLNEELLNDFIKTLFGKNFLFDTTVRSISWRIFRDPVFSSEFSPLDLLIRKIAEYAKQMGCKVQEPVEWKAWKRLAETPFHQLFAEEIRDLATIASKLSEEVVVGVQNEKERKSVGRTRRESICDLTGDKDVDFGRPPVEREPYRKSSIGGRSSKGTAFLKPDSYGSMLSMPERSTGKVCYYG
jgi:hypothetical protein